MLHNIGIMVPDIHAKFHNQQFIMRRAIKHFLGENIKIIVYNESAQAAKLLNTRQQSAAALEGYLATCCTGCGLLSNSLANAYFVLAFN